MTKIHWFLQTDVFEENLSRLIQIIKEYKDTYELIKYVPFSQSGLYYPLQRIEYEEPIIYYGSLNLVRSLEMCGIGRAIYCNLDKMKCSSYYSYYGRYLFNDDYMILPFGEIDRLRNLIFDRFGIKDDIFMRPDSGFKTFTGGLLNKAESLNHFLVNNVVFPEELVIITQPKQIEKEWRMVVVDREVVASSQYHSNGLLETSKGCPDHVLSFAKEVVSSTESQPDDAFILDIAENADKIGVMECNSFSCSGLYECDLSPIVEAIRKLVIYGPKC